MIKSNLNHLNLLYLNNDNLIPSNIKQSFKMIFKNSNFVNNLSYAEKLILTHNIDIIIVSPFDKDFKSYDFLKKIKTFYPNIEILISSKYKNEDILLKCIKLQVFDFLQEPIRVEDLIVTLNKLSKKFTNYNNEITTFNKIYKYNYSTKEVYLNNTTIKLTKNESKLVELLLVKKDVPLSRNEIELNIWNDIVVSDSTFKSLIKRVRNKLGKDTLKNSPGHGYFLT